MIWGHDPPRTHEKIIGRKLTLFTRLFVSPFSGYRPGKREKMKKTTTDTTTIGGRIKAKRIEAGLSQEKLAEMLMIKQNTLSNYENNSHDVPTDVLSDISRIFNTTPSYIVWGSCVEDDWTTEISNLFGSIKNPTIRATAIKQLKALVEIDAELS